MVFGIILIDALVGEPIRLEQAHARMVVRIYLGHDVRVASRDRRIIADPSKDRGEQHTAKTVALLGQGRGYIRNRVRVRRPL